MQAMKRYGLVVITCILVIVFYNGYKWAITEQANDITVVGNRAYRSQPQNSEFERALQALQSFDEQEYYETFEDDSPVSKRHTRQSVYKHKKCRMESCFDFELCRKRGFYIYVYPNSAEKLSPNYKSILSSIRSSRYYTSDPDRACLYVLSLDTLDRDPLSADFIRNIGTKISRLKHWNNGRNHVIFNLYSGTWPDYLEDLGFNLGEAILAKASFSDINYRPGFDVSLPLFGKTHPDLHGATGTLKANYYPPRRKYLLTFKGKRYTYGIGSTTRNALFHLHNGEDIIMLTTCKHGKEWKAFSDKKCESDNIEYEKWDYQELLHDSTFCMVPRGRRLGSFRFLESLQTACIPVVLANGWLLPFAEIIDWTKASLAWEERLLLQVPTVLRDLDDDVIMSLRQQTQFLWDNYFSSTDVIIRTVFEIIYDRIYADEARPTFVWNMGPGPLFYMPEHSSSPQNLPFYYGKLGLDAPDKFTAVIQGVSPVLSSAAPIVKLVKNLLQTTSCSQIIIIWHCSKTPPPPSRWRALQDPDREIPVTVIDDGTKVMSRRFYPFQDIRSDAVLSLDEDAKLNVQEIDFAFQVWRQFPDRIVGFPARSHYWNEDKKKWAYTSKWSNSFSMILTGAAFIHKYYFALYTDWLPENDRQLVDELSNCEDILMNMLVAHVTKLPPIKVTQKKQYKESSTSAEKDAKSQGGGVVADWSDPHHFADRQNCMKSFVDSFGYMPLISSEARMDPALYKDNVSIKRKRFPKIEI